MSGIAGIVLTLGMAVDANVLIYERAKEELRAGKKTAVALADGYKNAFSAIFDSNLTSIITGIILFYFGTGPIRGFATTLIIGILCSFFTAVFLTRIVYEYFMQKGKWQELTFTTGLSKKLLIGTKYNFMKARKVSFIVFGAAALLSIALLSFKGLVGSIDFTGGRNFVVQFEQQVEPETVEGYLTEISAQAIAIGTDKKTVRISTNYGNDSEDIDIDAQIECTMNAVDAIYRSRGMSLKDVSGALIYLKEDRYRENWERWLDAHSEYPRAHSRAIVADVCRDEWLFEIESDALKWN
jgi:SecD/SecF fusion protein